MTTNRPFLRARALYPAAAVLGAAAVGAPAALAAPPWNPIGVVSPVSAPVSLATNASGGLATIAIRGLNRFVHAQVGSTRSGLGRATTIAKGRGYANARIALAPDGTAVAVWSLVGGIQASVHPPRGRWSRPQLISPKNVIGASGPNQIYTATQPDLAIDSRGNATVVWLEHGPGYNYAVRSSYRPARGRFGAPVDVSVKSALLRTFEPHVAVAANGDAAAVWIEDTSSSSSIRVVKASVRHAGVWQAPMQLSAPAAPGLGVDSPGVVIAADGEGVAAWRELSVQTPFPAVVKAAIRPAGAAAFGPASALSSAGEQQPGISGGPEVATDALGNAIVIWSRQVAASEGHNLVTEAARRKAGASTWAPLTGLVPPRVLGSIPLVSIAPGGRMVLAWGDRASARGIVRAVVTSIRAAHPAGKVETIFSGHALGVAPAKVVAVSLAGNRAVVAAGQLRDYPGVALFGRSS